MTSMSRARYRTLLSTSLSPWTGYGNDGLALSLALSEGKHEVALLPRHVSTPLPAKVAALLTRAVEGPYDMLLDHVDPGASGMSHIPRDVARHKALWSMWEFRGLAPDLIEDGVAKRLQTYDTVVCYDEVTREAFQPHLRDDQRVLIQQGGYDASLWDPEGEIRALRSWGGTFRFAMLGALNDRKNPWAAIKAFSLLKERHGDAFDAELHLKTVHRSLHPGIEDRYPGVKIHYETWSLAQVQAFYALCHVYVAPSWGEGKNLPAIEAQATGMACLATNFGGHAQWMPHTGAFDIPFVEAEHVPGMASARADVEGLADRMWSLYSDRSRAREQGALAARTLPSLMDWSVVVRRLEDALY